MDEADTGGVGEGGVGGVGGGGVLPPPLPDPEHLKIYREKTRFRSAVKRT